MKILLIEPCYKNFGGYFRATNIASSLAKHDFQVDVLIPSDKKFFFSIKKNSINPNFSLYLLPRFYINFYIQGRLLRGIYWDFVWIIG